MRVNLVKRWSTKMHTFYSIGWLMIFYDEYDHDKGKVKYSYMYQYMNNFQFNQCYI